MLIKGVIALLKVENHIGTITITEKYLKDLIGHTVTNCFGVADMSDSKPIESLLAFFKDKGKNNKINKGVSISTKDNNLVINLHITVAYGTNISVITKSISEKVKFAVEEATGVEVLAVNVFIDNINS